LLTVFIGIDNLLNSQIGTISRLPKGVKDEETSAYGCTLLMRGMEDYTTHGAHVEFSWDEEKQDVVITKYRV
jgi:hypothetical protein